MSRAATAAPSPFRVGPRVGDWGCTFTGRQYWPEDARPGDFDIVDIAHALAHQCRFGGHCATFYSVAQHAVLVSQVCDPSDALWGLLHDAAEAYLVDLPRPVKRAEGFERYRAMEDACLSAIAAQFGLPRDVPKSVKLADEAVLAAEARDLMPPASVVHWFLPVPPPDGMRVVPWSPAKARDAFLRRFEVVR